MVLLGSEAIVFCYLSVQPYWNDTYVQIYRLGFVVVYALLSFGIIKYNFFKQFYVWAIICAFAGYVMANAHYMQALLQQHLQSKLPLLVTNITVILQILILFPIAKKLLDKIIVFLNYEYKNIWPAFASIPILVYTLTLSSTWSIEAKKVSELSYLIVRHFSLYCMLIVTFILYSILRQAEENAKLSEQAQRTELLLNSEQERYLMLTEYIEETKRIRHDIRHHISVVQAYLEDGKKEVLRDYMQEYSKGLPKEIPLYNTGNYAVNAIMGYYTNQAELKGIRIDADIKLPHVSEIKDIELTIVFGNLLENALEACDRQQGKDKFISVSTKINGRYLVIVVDNSYDGIIKKENEEIFSTKRSGRGIGIESVKAVVKKYDGVYQLDYTEHVFSSSVMLKV